MPNKLWRSGALAAFLLLVNGVSSPAAAQEDSPPLRRGVGYHHPLTWGRVTGSNGMYLWPPYEGQNYALHEDLLKQVKKAGFDHIRLTVDPGPFLHFVEPEKQLALRDLLLDEVKRINALGLDVIVDLHPVKVVSRYNPEAYLGESFFQNYVRMVRYIAEGLKSADERHVVLEPINEPACARDYAKCDRLMFALHQAIREVSPSIGIIVSGGSWGDLNGLLAFDPSRYAGSNVIYTFHYYNEFEFTHQGVPTSPPEVRSFTSGLGYPRRPEQFEAFFKEYLARLDAAHLSEAARKKLSVQGRARLDRYFNETGDAQMIEKEFGLAAKWASDHHIPAAKIYVGEFGVGQIPSVPPCIGGEGPPPADRLQWIADVRAASEKNGFGWAYWALTANCGGMQLVSLKDSQTLDAETLRALGLGAR